MKISAATLRRKVEEIRFRKVQPKDPFDFIGFRGDGQPGADVLNTQLEGLPAGVPARLEPLLQVRGMSTIANAYLIASLVASLDDDECYLNIGCWEGYSFLAGVLQPQKWSVGVDNFSEFAGRDAFLRNFDRLRHPRARFVECDYRLILAEPFPMPIGLYFYDGSHAYRDQRIALEASLPSLSPDAVIIVDDTNWPDPRRATLEFVAAHAPEFEVALDIQTAGNGHPTFWNGLMVLKRCQAKRTG